MHTLSEDSLARYGLSWTVMARYLAETATAEEIARVRAWADDEPIRRRELDFLRRVWTVQLSHEVSSFGTEKAIGELRRRMESSVASPASDVIRRGRKISGLSRAGARGRSAIQGTLVWPAVTIVGAVVGLIMGFTGWHRGSMPGPSGSHRESAMSRYVTANGQRATITLPDGNVVALGVASRLDVPADYLTGNHTLKLQGEAIFTVHHRGTAPLIVESGAATARVLGTKFLVRHYSTDSATLVAVRDGRVSVRSATSQVVLSAAQQARMWPKWGIQTGTADVTQFSFANGVLTLRSAPFVEAMADLGRWYDADIRIGDPALAKLRVTGEYATGSLAELVEILEGTFEVRVVRSGRTLTLFPR